MRLRVKTVYSDAHYLQIYHNLCDREQVNSYFVTTQTGNTVLVQVYVNRLLLCLIKIKHKPNQQEHFNFSVNMLFVFLRLKMFLKHGPELNAFTSQASDESVSPSQTPQTLRSSCRYDLCAPRNTPAAPLLFGLSAGVQRSSTLRSLGLLFLPTGTNGGTRRLRNNCYLKSEGGGETKD